MNCQQNRLTGLLNVARAISIFCSLSVAASASQSYKTLINFDGSNGAQPVYVSLVQGSDGSLYGTTLGGGTNGAGTVFKLAPWGKLITLYDFCSQANCTDGSGPYSGLIHAPDGNFYGTTMGGGTFGYGTIFTVTPHGVLTTLHSFDFSAGEGAQPFSALVRSPRGDFYGTASGGGPSNGGTIFKITKSGAFTKLYAFDGSAGSTPMTSLVEGTDGAFYGTAGQVVFRVTQDGLVTPLHTFSGPDGFYPNQLIRATNGFFYGTTYGGGANNTCNNGCGTVFRIDLNGSLKTLYNFDSLHGANPIAALTEGSDGNFYGTTYAGGTGGDWGTVFQMTPTGTLMTLHSFSSTDGGQPYGPVAQSTNGKFYGTATNAGPSNGGTLFRISLGVAPFVEIAPTAAKVTTTVTILGPSLGGTSKVAFNGQPAAFIKISDTELKASVPTGATTGRVTVTTPTGVLQSNTVFRVNP